MSESSIVPADPPDVLHHQSGAIVEASHDIDSRAEEMYEKMKDKWDTELKRYHLRNGRPYYSPIGRGPLGLSFRLGCNACSVSSDPRVKKDAMARFVCNSYNQMQIGYLKRHCQGEAHRIACEAMGITVAFDQGLLKKSIEETVPQLPMFLWALQNCFTSSSYVDYQKFVATHDALSDSIITGSPSDELVGKYTHQRTCKQCVHSMGSVILKGEQEFLRQSVRIAIAADDRDPDRLLRMRVVRANPTIQSKDITAAIIREHGSFAQDAADSIMDAIRFVCMVRKGRRDRVTLQSDEEDYFDSALFNTIKSAIFQAATDGCEVEVQGVQLLRQQGSLPKLRYYFRDRAHTSQTVHKNTIKLLKPRDRELLELMIEGEHSFAKRVRYSRLFRMKWQSTADELDELYIACCHLAYAEPRYDSRSKPMTRLVKSWPRVMATLKLCADDTSEAHRDCQIWARNILHKLSGEEGWHRTVAFCIETDYVVSGRCLTKVQDKSATDVSLAQHEVEETLTVQEALFHEGRILSAERNDSYTWCFLNAMREYPSQIYFNTDEVADLVWPVSERHLERPLRLCRSLFAMSKEFLTANYPDWSWRSAFRCFDNSDTRLPEEVRLSSFERIAKKEGLCPSTARIQFYEHIPLARKLYGEYGCNKRVWTVIAERHRLHQNSPKFKPQRSVMVLMILTYLGILDTTSDLERIFSRLCWLTLKHRSFQLSLFVLLDSLKVVTTMNPDIRRYIKSVGFTSTSTSAMLTQELEGTEFIKESQLQFHEFFGKYRPSQSRKVSELGPTAKARFTARKSETLTRFDATRESEVEVWQPGKKISERQRHKLWVQSAQSMVAQMKSDKAKRAQGIEVPAMKTIFGTHVPAGGVAPLPKTALQKAAVKAISKLKNESFRQFMEEEESHGLARSVKPVRTNFRKRAVPKSAPRFKSAKVAVAKALVCVGLR